MFADSDRGLYIFLPGQSYKRGHDKRALAGLPIITIPLMGSGEKEENDERRDGIRTKGDGIKRILYFATIILWLVLVFSPSLIYLVGQDSGRHRALWIQPCLCFVHITIIIDRVVFFHGLIPGWLVCAAPIMAVFHDNNDIHCR
jgi:hypothetical protein